MHRPPARSAACDAARRLTPVAVLALVVIAASFAVRLALLDRQSYWIDELFSVDASAGTFGHVLTASATEVHPPFYPGLLWGWIQLGGSAGAHEVWTRLFSTVCAAVAVGVAHRSLRPVRLGTDVRWALTTATAAAGAGMAYATETRSYALLLAGSVGLTAATVRVAVAADGVTRRDRVAWAGWGLLAATTHLFGAVLVAGAAAVLAVATRRRGRPAAERVRSAVGRGLLGLAACLPQLAWLATGSLRPGFAADTAWIPEPGPADVGTLLTTTFASGGLALHRDGFAWTDPTGAVLAALGAAAAVVVLVRVRRRAVAPAGAAPDDAEPDDAAPDDAAPEGTEPEGAADVGRAAAVLLALAVVVIVAALTAARWRHVWTLRNLLVVTPALGWGTICLLAAAAGSLPPGGAPARRVLAGTVIALFGVALVPVAVDLHRPYKTDFRELVEQVAAARAQSPDLAGSVIGRLPPATWRAAEDDRDGSLYRQLTLESVASPDAVVRIRGPQVVIIYRRLLDPDLDRDAAALAGRLGPGCERVPLTGVGLVRCG